MKIFNNKTILLFLIVCLLNSCRSKTEKDDPVIMIGNMSYSQEEYNVLFNKYLKNKGVDNSKSISKVLIDDWQNEIVEHSFLLAAALETGVQNDKTIEEKVQNVSKQMILQKGGLLYQKSILQNIDITNKELDEAIKYLGFEYQIECIVFISEDAMGKVLADDSIISNDKFYQLVELSNYNTDISYQVLKWNWISGSFIGAREKICVLNEGQISLPIKTVQGVVLVRVNQKNKIPDEYLKLYNKDKLYKILIQAEEQVLAEKLDTKLYNMSNLKINSEVADQLWNILKNYNVTRIEEDIAWNILNENIITYECNSSKINVTVKEFIAYYNNLMIKKIISSKQLLYYYLKEIPWETQALKYAEDLGLTNDKYFLIEEKYFRDKTIVDEFIRRKYKKQLLVSEEDVKMQYTKDIQTYNRGEYAIVSLFYFESQKTAWDGYNEFRKINWPATDSVLKKFTGLKKWQLNQKIHYKDNVLRQDISEKIFQIGEEYIPPQKVGNNYLIILKKGIEGERFIPLAELGMHVKNEIFAKRYTTYRDNLIDSLKVKYNLRVNFPNV